VLYQLSYLGMRADFTIGRGAVKKITALLMIASFWVRIHDMMVVLSADTALLISPFSFDNLPCEH
jgi:hypothetical protein